MRLSDRELKHLELGDMFHDGGKVGIPPSILLKAGPLTEEEWTVIRAHPQLGEKILEPIDQLELVRPIVRLCHERYDGHGGDTGVSGEAIPIQARIIYACDAYHAMLSDRPYRSGMSADDARAALREGAGTQFDPRVVDALIVALEEDASLTPA